MIQRGKVCLAEEASSVFIGSLSLDQFSWGTKQKHVLFSGMCLEDVWF